MVLRADHPLRRLVANGGAVRRSGEARPFMHLKSYSVGDALRTGSANASKSGLRDQDNDLVLIRGGDAAARFDAVFETLWARTDNQAVGF